jgi:hypothetical protein
MAAAAANADLALAYHGKLVATGGHAKISTKVPMTVEFRLYRDEQPGETVPLWGRAMPVRFDNAGMFYVELSDGNGAAVPDAAHERLADAIAAAGGPNAWLSIKPFGYGELLPRKRLGGVHRAERATTARKVERLDAGGIRAEAISAGSCEIGGSLNVTNSFVVGGKIENTIDGTKNVAIGSPTGTVLFTGTFDRWGSPSSIFRGSTHIAVDILAGFKKSGYGVLSLPVQAGYSVALPSGCESFLIQQFLIGNYSPFF